jgi:hypothetical protein
MTTLAKVSILNVNGLAEDTIVNTFHFGDIGSIEFGIPLIESIRDFYTLAPTGQPAAVGAYLGQEMSRAALALKIDLYNLDDPSPRVSYAGGSYTLPAPNSAESLPAEVAMVVSWKAAPVSGVAAGRLRGRNYIGSLTTAAGALSTEPVRPSTGFIDTLEAAALDFIAATFSEKFVIYSRTSVPDRASEVVGGFIDNAFDTMRSRGPAPTTRRLF